MEQILLTAGLACIVAAIAGEGLKGLGFEFPKLSFKRQVAIGMLGLMLIGFSQVNRLSSLPAKDTSKPKDETSTVKPPTPSTREQDKKQPAEQPDKALAKQQAEREEQAAVQAKKMADDAAEIESKKREAIKAEKAAAQQRAKLDLEASERADEENRKASRVVLQETLNRATVDVDNATCVRDKIKFRDKGRIFKVWSAYITISANRPDEEYYSIYFFDIELKKNSKVHWYGSSASCPGESEQPLATTCYLPKASGKTQSTFKYMVVENNDVDLADEDLPFQITLPLSLTVRTPSHKIKRNILDIDLSCK
jgi:hypothetical protein